MIRWRQGRVREFLGSWPGAVECWVDVDGDEPTTLRSLAYPDLVGHLDIGDQVWLNTTALDAGLGTGGYAFVVTGPRPPIAPPVGPGHIVKARYTPQQVMVLAVDEPASPHHELLRDADDLDAMPVVTADLHSSLPAVVAGAIAEVGGTGRPPRIAYVMTDGAALPLWFSKTVATLRSTGMLVGTVTAGQAFGGDLEAVTLHSALLAARLVLEADVTVVTPGPGVAGTGSRWGFSGVGVGETVNATAALAGRSVAVLRISAADARTRHRGVSHHSLTALGRVALAPTDIVLPTLPQHGELSGLIREHVGSLVVPRGRHRLIEVDTEGLLSALDSSPVAMTTMGRDLAQDAPAFLAAAAAGRHAARLLRR